MNEISDKNGDGSTNIQKNIIYGNPVVNKYGKVRCFCCPISTKGIFHNILTIIFLFYYYRAHWRHFKLFKNKQILQKL